MRPAMMIAPNTSVMSLPCPAAATIGPTAANVQPCMIGSRAPNFQTPMQVSAWRCRP